MKQISTTCAYCGVGCGIKAEVTGERTVLIKGDESHPANQGRLCSKGTHLGETVELDGRLLYPEIAGARANWDEAAALVAARFADTIAKHGPDSVAFYVSGQLLTEDYYAANKLMKGFIGSGNIDTNSRLCMASAVAAHNRAFGEDIVACSYADLEEADLILLVGSNTAWCHPVIWQRIEAARAKRGTKLVVIDPRRTETADCADLHIPVAPDGDVALFSGLLLNMLERGQIAADYLADHVHIPAHFWDTLEGGADGAGIDDALFAQLADLVAAHPKMVTLFSMGANQSSSGTDKGNAIINLHLATGRIGKIGAGPFSMTGQPNAMGGREVGGLASTLAVHMGFGEEERRAAQDFWQSPVIAGGPGLKAVDMFRAIHSGQIKALWVMATNPAVSMPNSGFVREALEKCEFLVVSDMFADTDTAKFADVTLPALGWGEKDGTVTNSERMISRQRALFPAPGEARADWRIICDVAAKMGFAEAFSFPNSAAIFREFAAQTGFRNDGKRLLDIAEYAQISDDAYAALEPFQWGGSVPFAAQKFSHPNGRAAMIAVRPPERAALTQAAGLCLNTGRYRDQWHTMTRTGLSPRLSQHRREPLLEIHPDDAAQYGILDQGLARIINGEETSVFRVSLHDGQRKGEIFVPMHWTDHNSSGGRGNRMTSSKVDPVSGQPAFKNTPVSLEAIMPEWRAFLITRARPILPPLLYWTTARIAGGWLTELAGLGNVDIDSLLPDGERLETMDMQRGMRRIALRDDEGRLAAALFLTRSGTLPARDWIASQLVCDEPADGVQWLAARPREAGPDKGEIVCVCFNIGVKQILSAISSQSLTSVEAVGASLNAGTNCGSCRPAIAKLLVTARAEASTEAAE